MNHYLILFRGGPYDCQYRWIPAICCAREYHVAESWDSPLIYTYLKAINSDNQYVYILDYSREIA